MNSNWHCKLCDKQVRCIISMLKQAFLLLIHATIDNTCHLLTALVHFSCVHRGYTAIHINCCQGNGPGKYLHFENVYKSNDTLQHTYLYVTWTTFISHAFVKWHTVYKWSEESTCYNTSHVLVELMLQSPLHRNQSHNNINCSKENLTSGCIRLPKLHALN